MANFERFPAESLRDPMILMDNKCEEGTPTAHVTMRSIELSGEAMRAFNAAIS